MADFVQVLYRNHHAGSNPVSSVESRLFRDKERSHSGRVQRFTKPPTCYRVREFESRPLRTSGRARHNCFIWIGASIFSSCSKVVLSFSVLISTFEFFVIITTNRVI